MGAERKRILICDENLYQLGRLTTWVHDQSYGHVMATNLERAQYQMRDQKFDLVVADLSGFDAYEWLREMEIHGQLVLWLSASEVPGSPRLTKPTIDFESFREPFLQKVAELLGE